MIRSITGISHCTQQQNWTLPAGFGTFGYQPNRCSQVVLRAITYPPLVTLATGKSDAHLPVGAISRGVIAYADINAPRIDTVIQPNTMIALDSNDIIIARSTENFNPHALQGPPPRRKHGVVFRCQ
jgi:hypothetical protein